MRQERLKRRILEDIQRQLSQQLAARGLEGQLTLTHQHATLTVGGSSRRVPLEDLPSRWRQLTPSQRREQLEPLVRTLQQARVAGSGKRFWQSSLGVLAIVAVTAALALALLRGISRVRTQQASQDAEQAVARAELERKARSCETARSRVMRGGTASPTDADGWNVEVLLVTSRADAGPQGLVGVDEFFHGAGPGELRVVSTEAELLGDGQDASAVHSVQQADAFEEHRFTLRGDYVRAYFDESGQAAWARLVTRFFRVSGADYGALMARCAHQDSLHVGAWFGGRTAQHAASSLLHYAGAFSETPILLSSFLHDDPAERPPPSLLALFDKRTRQVDRTQLAMWVSKDQGLVTGKQGQPIVLTFPHGDSNRASRASLRVARRLEIANTR